MRGLPVYLLLLISNNAKSKDPFLFFISALFLRLWGKYLFLFYFVSIFIFIFISFWRGGGGEDIQS